VSRGRRFVIMVLDGVGIGELPDAAAYGDVGSDTLGNLARFLDLRLPHFERLGLGNIAALPGISPVKNPLALAGRLAELSAGKDTTAGHWEHMGVVTKYPLPTYPEGFPADLIAEYVRRIGRKVMGNRPASGTEIIAELGEAHLENGRPIVYTSADSVFQIAAHVDVIPLEDLYRYCEIARELLAGEHAVGRVIARPFEGVPGAFRRTSQRKDFSLEPPEDTYLDLLGAKGIPVTAIGKVAQIYAGRGITKSLPAASNEENLETLRRVLAEEPAGLIFTNLVDFDMKWGHRNDPEGFAAGLKRVDAELPSLLALLGSDDRLLLTADHGVDPTTSSTDHTREYVPLLYLPRPSRTPDAVYEGTFADTGATMYAHLTGEDPPGAGVSVERLSPKGGWRPYAARPSDDLSEAVALLERELGPAPESAVVLGSGLDGLTDGLQKGGEMEYSRVPGWPVPRVEGHAAGLVRGGLQGRDALWARGRAHRYEGYSGEDLRFPLRVLSAWGVRRVLLLNASGALLSGISPGWVAEVRRIVDLQARLENPAEGAVDVQLGPLSVPGSAVSEGPLPDPVAAAAPSTAASRSRDPGTVVYAAVGGPQYETAAEAAALSSLGADVVGMSTADEVRAARVLGLDVAVLTVVTNQAGAEPRAGEDGHADVLDEVERLLPAVRARIIRWLDSG